MGVSIVSAGKSGGFLEVVVEGYVQGTQPNERQLVLIQSVAKLSDTDSGALVGMARGL